LTLPFRPKSHVVSLAIVTLIVIAIGTLSTLDWDEFNQNAIVARRARAIAENGNRLLSALEATEAADLGYLLTGDAQYLATIDADLPVINSCLTELGRPGAGLEDAATVERIRSLVTGKVQDVQQTIELRRAGNGEEALAYLGTNRSRQKMEEVRSSIIAVTDSQYKLFTERSFLARQHAARTRLIVLLGTGLLAVLLVAANVHVHRLIRAQDTLIGELEAARDREERAKNAFETTLESIGDAVISVDAVGRVQFLNPAAEALTQWPRTSAAGVPLAEVFPIVNEDSGEPLGNPATQAMAEGSLVTLPRHTVLLTRNGLRIPINDSAAPLRNRQGEAAGAVLVFRDVSPQREAQRRLEDSERRYRLLFESNPEPMWVFEAATLKFVEVNDAAIAHYGFSRDEFLGMTLREIRPPEDIPQLLADTDPSTNQNAGGPAPRRHLKKDGTIIFVEITAHPLVLQGRDCRLVLAHDITTRVQLEEQLRQSQKLEAIGRLAGGVAHDFNNMLTVISGYTELLASSLAPDDENRAALTEIDGAARRASNLTQQLLAFSRRQVLQPQVLNLNTSISNMEKMLGRLLGEDIEVRTILAPDLWNVSADPGQVDQILMNLAVNARDAMANGGTLTIQTTNATLDDEYAASHVGVLTGEYVRLSIADTGHGMDAATTARLFEPFFTTKEVGRGTGLGLSTVYGIVKQSHGNIWVYSEPGKGTTFAVYLPRCASPAPQERTIPDRSIPTQTGHSILLVEDDPNVCKLVSAMLMSSGYTVLSANTAEEAISFCSQSNPIDLLLCDMVLPQTDGPTIAQAVLALRPGIPVLFMSGYTEHPVLRQEGVGPTTPFLQKPFTREMVASKVRSLLNPGA
jgi:two-component system cell cycle sensor histidine kinase/response regulator CckA